MEFIENFKLGTLEGLSAFVVLGTVAIVVLVALIVILINGVKAVKERKDAKETEAENAFYAEYGVTGDELRLNERLAAKRERLKTRKRLPDVKWKVIEKVVEVEKPVDKVVEKVVEQPVAGGATTVAGGTPIFTNGVSFANGATTVVTGGSSIIKYIELRRPRQDASMDYVPVVSTFEDGAINPLPNTVFDDDVIYPLPMTVFDDNDPDTVFLTEVMDEDDDIVYLEEYDESKKEETAKSNENAPYPLPINEQLIDEFYYSKSPEIDDTREEDWSKYNGNFAGFYYNPYDGCYHEGYAPKSLVKKLVEKQAEFNETYPDNSKKYDVSRIDAPFMPLKTPKNERKEAAPVEGFDDASIFGKYVIEHTTKEDGSEEYYYTLYSAKGTKLYESDNYSSLDYCKRGIKLFRAHVNLGLFTINSSNGKYYYVLTRKQYVHKGVALDDFEEATDLIKQVKNYYGTKVIREQ